MLTALLDDKAEFVELFLQNGLSMREFLSPQILCQLYAGVSHPPPKKTTTRKFIDIWCSGFHSLFSNFFLRSQAIVSSSLYYNGKWFVSFLIVESRCFCCFPSPCITSLRVRIENNALHFQPIRRKTKAIVFPRLRRNMIGQE